MTSFPVRIPSVALRKTWSCAGALLLSLFSATALVAQPLEKPRDSGSSMADLIKASQTPSGLTASSTSTPRLYGVLQNTTGKAALNYSAGCRVALIELSWSAYNTADGTYNSVYKTDITNKIQSFRNAGYTQFMLDFGIQYPPNWVRNLPNSRFVNQYGTPYAETAIGKNIVNGVFNPTIRTKISAYIQRVFQDFGTNWQSVRLGGLWYGELHYPPANYGTQENCFWGFDANASLNRPMPNWKPGDASPNGEAATFANWYLNSLKNYHDWQIAEVRRWYSGNICMLYPGFGIRANELQAAINVNLKLKGSKILSTGEMQAGNDFSRFINGITDPNVIVYSTHMDTPDSWSNEGSIDPNKWCPIRWLGWLADTHNPPLRKWGENTGNAQLVDMTRTFNRIQQSGAMGVMWAFESELYDGQHATISNYATHIAANP